MADGKRKKSMKPKPGIIDLEATEIGQSAAEAAVETPLDEPDVPDPLAEEPPPEVDDPDLFEAEPRSQIGVLIAAGVAGAAIALFVFVLILASGFIPSGGSDAALGSRVAELETQLSAAKKEPPVPAADDSALRAEIETLKQEIGQLRAAPAAPAPNAPAAADPQIAELSAKLDALSRNSEDSASKAAFEQLAARVNEISAQAAAARAPDPEVQRALAASKSAAALAAVASLESAVARGAPYAAALSAVRRQMPDAALGVLEAHSERGVAPAAVLAARLQANLEKAPAPESTATGFVDRLAEGARGLVRIKPVDGTVPEISASDPWSARNAVAIRLSQGDYKGALADWEKLDGAAKGVTKDDAAALTARLEADTALDGLRASALGLAEAKP